MRVVWETVKVRFEDLDEFAEREDLPYGACADVAIQYAARRPEPDVGLFGTQYELLDVEIDDTTPPLELTAEQRKAIEQYAIRLWEARR
jgi:hypothetical protein